MCQCKLTVVFGNKASRIHRLLCGWNRYKATILTYSAFFHPNEIQNKHTYTFKSHINQESQALAWDYTEEYIKKEEASFSQRFSPCAHFVRSWTFKTEFIRKYSTYIRCALVAIVSFQSNFFFLLYFISCCARLFDTKNK